MREIAAGDVLVVVRLDRLARSVSQLLEVIEQMRSAACISARCATQSIRDSAGDLFLAGSGGVAQPERALIAEHQGGDEGRQGAAPVGWQPSGRSPPRASAPISTI
ncbi:recombinase family protein [Pararhizobium sp. LjRoot235]|uniref:recombinase family protein n=1 Tax=Pararhizobium sp. LjRoot235 TaxID=3342291 RepID=UPI003ED0ADEE